MAGLERLKSMAAVNNTSPLPNNKLGLIGFFQRAFALRKMPSSANGITSKVLPTMPFSASFCR